MGTPVRFRHPPVLDIYRGASLCLLLSLLKPCELHAVILEREHPSHLLPRFDVGFDPAGSLEVFALQPLIVLADLLDLFAE